MRSLAREKRVLLAAGAVLSLSAAVQAQSTPPGVLAANVSAHDELVLNEIVVTARRREENAQTVPVSLTAFSASTLSNWGIRSTSDLQMRVPGVIFNGAATDLDTTYTIRGQGKAIIGPGLPSVITYINEVPMPSWGSALPTYDVTNVQVLKGPQGTLFGRNTTGGAVLVYSKVPTFDGVKGYIEGQLGDYRDQEAQGAINIPLIDDILAVRLAGDIERRKGYARNITTGTDVNQKHSEAFRVSVLFRPVDWLSNTLIYDRYYSNVNGSGATALTPLPSPVNPALAAVVASVHANRRDTIAATIPGNDRAQLWGISNTTKADLGPVTIKNIFGYRSTNVYTADDATGVGIAPIPLSIPQLGLARNTPGILVDTTSGRQDRQISDELQVAGTVLDKSINWLAGAFYLNDAPTGPDYATEVFYRPTSPSLMTSFIVNKFLGGIWPLDSQADNLYTDESKALFGNVSYDLSKTGSFLKGVTLNAGYRHTWDKEGLCANSRPSILLATGQSVVAPYNSTSQCRADTGGFVRSPANAYAPSYSQYASFSASTYTFGVDYKLNDDVFLYFTTRKGYRAGGLNTPLLAPILAPYQAYAPQTVTDYEIGTHTQWSAGGWKGRLNVAAFTGTYDNLQLQATGIFAGTLPGVTAANAPSSSALTLNAGSARVSGLELDGIIAPFSDLTVGYAASYLNPAYTRLNSPGFLQPFFNTGPFTGSPRWSYSADIRYRLPTSTAGTIGSFYVNAEYYHVADVYQGYALLPAHEVTNFSLQWVNIGQTHLDLTVFVNNAFNSLYVQNVFVDNGSLGVFSGNYAPPRMAGLRLRYSFGHQN
jgi:iron complex outermembrane receptor protein